MESRPEQTNNKPSKLPYKLIRQITNDFHKDQELGRGAFGIVYKGMYDHGEIAVKVLRSISGGLDDTEFQKEFNNLKGLKHDNIVEILGFCNEFEDEPAVFEGKPITAGRLRTALCFEYLKNGGLNNFISDQVKEDEQLDWSQRYTIIKGVCEGLKYLHDGLEHPIIHLDLKPENILLDNNMIAKIADFGISRLLGEENTKKTISALGTVGYFPPEYIKHQIISTEFDIFSLGVIIVKIMVGSDQYNSMVEMTTRKCVSHVHAIWKNKLSKTPTSDKFEVYCNQVKRCIGIALDCLKLNRHERPTIQHIVSSLNETDIMIGAQGIQNEQLSQDDGDSSTLLSDEQALKLVEHKSGKRLNETETSYLVTPHFERVDSELLDSEDSELLRVQPRELCFPFMSSLEVSLPKKAMISCSLRLNNKENDRVAFMLVANNPKRYLTKTPLCGVVPPRCVYTLSIMPKQPPPTLSSSGSSGDFFTLYSVAVSEYKLRNVDKDSDSVRYKKFFEKAKNNTYPDEEVHEVTLKASICDRPADQVTSSSFEIIMTPGAQQVSSIHVHPTEPWILTTNHTGSIRVWNYHTMETPDSFDLAREHEPVRAAKFIAREKWVIVGDYSGSILVYSYDRNQKVKHLKNAHDRGITTLAVHPTQSIVLSSSADDDEPLIKLWNWDKGWECTREFRGHNEQVTQVTFNPNDTDSFASASFDGTIKIWSIGSDDPNNIITLKVDYRESLLCVDYFTRRDRQHLIVGCNDKTVQIWKLAKKGCYLEPGMKGCFDKLEGHANDISAVSLHPELPLLITGSLDGTIRVWDSTTYKLENIIGFNLGKVYAFGCIKGSRRIVVGCHHGIAMTEVSLP